VPRVIFACKFSAMLLKLFFFFVVLSFWFFKKTGEVLQDHVQLNKLKGRDLHLQFKVAGVFYLLQKLLYQ